MLLILLPFATFSILTALYDTMNRQRRINQLSIENKRLNVMQKDRYELVESPTAFSVRYQPNTEQSTLQDCRPDGKNKTSYTFPDNNEADNNNGSVPKKQIIQMDADVTYPVIKLNDTELEQVRAGYLQRMTGERKISKKNKESYITARNGKIFDVRKIIQVMQKKIVNGNCKREHKDNMMLKLNSLQMGIYALMAQDELQKDFAIPDDCIVYRTVKSVTYGELKQMVEKEKLAAQLAEFRNTDNIIVSTSQRSKIKTLKINYKVKNPTPNKH